jgi:predicted DNA-binding WGR domain protein
MMVFVKDFEGPIQHKEADLAKVELFSGEEGADNEFYVRLTLKKGEEIIDVFVKSYNDNYSASNDYDRQVENVKKASVSNGIVLKTPLSSVKKSPTFSTGNGISSVMSSRGFNVVKNVYLEYSDALSNKFWEGIIENQVGTNYCRLVRRWGKIGTNGQIMQDPLMDEVGAERLFNSMIKQKLSKGYKEINLYK